MSDAEMDDLWDVMRPYCEARGIDRATFEIGTRIIEAIDTPEKVEEAVRWIRSSKTESP